MATPNYSCLYVSGHSFTGDENTRYGSDKFTDWNTWESTKNRDLRSGTGDDSEEHLEILADDWTGQSLGGSVLTIDGFTTDATHYARIAALDPAADYGTAWNAAKAHSDCGGDQIYLRDDHVRIEGIQFEVTKDNTGNRYGIYIYNIGSGSDIRIQRCLFKGLPDAGGTANVFTAIRNNDSDSNILIENIIVDGFNKDGGGSPVAVGLYLPTGTITLRGVAALNCDQAYYIGSGATFTNCYDFLTDSQSFNGTGNGASSHNAFYLGSTPGWGSDWVSLVGDAVGDTLEDYASEDYTPAAGSDLAGAGVSDGRAADYLGQAFGAAYDIGPVERPAAGGGITPALLRAIERY